MIQDDRPICKKSRVVVRGQENTTRVILATTGNYPPPKKKRKEKRLQYITSLSAASQFLKPTQDCIVHQGILHEIMPPS